MSGGARSGGVGVTMTARQRERHRAAEQRSAIRTPVDDVAVDVWSAIQRSKHDGLSLPEMAVQMPEYTLSQLRAGKDRINHVLQEAREQPLVIRDIRGRGSVYKFPREVGEYQEFAMKRLREVLTRIGTEVARGEAAILRWPNDVPPYIPKLLNRLREDAGYLLDEMREFVGDEDGEG